MRQIDWNELPADYPHDGGRVPSDWPNEEIERVAKLGFMPNYESGRIHKLRRLSAHERMEHRRAHRGAA